MSLYPALVMDIDVPVELPGGNGFRDVSALFVDAASDIPMDTVVFTDGYTLTDAMNSFEIGEPRLDSGLMGDRELERKNPFDPLAPLLPQEICWILDRAYQYEMSWHEGNVLAHTVHTFLYLYCLDELDIDTISPAHYLFHPQDITRPPELVLIVLKAAVAGLLKCCDLSWRHLTTSELRDTEDWQSEKCDVPLLEGYQAPFILQLINEAIRWLTLSDKVTAFWKNALISRLEFRKTLLLILDTDVHKNREHYMKLVTYGRNHLRFFRSIPVPIPSSNSPALRAFDPYYARKLNTFLPLRAIELPEISKTWDAFERLMNGFEEIHALSGASSLQTWELAGNTGIWLPGQFLRLPIIRAITQETFGRSPIILSKYPLDWLSDHFLEETLGLSNIENQIGGKWQGSQNITNTFGQFRMHLNRILLSHIRAHQLNASRRRRAHMKELLDWQMLYDTLVSIQGAIDTDAMPPTDILLHFPKALLLGRLSIVREIILSGFQLELYTPEERVYEYWYLSEVLGAQLAIMEDLISAQCVTSEGALHELTFQSEFCSALKAMSSGMFAILLRKHSPITCWSRMKDNFTRRHKWAFRPEYDIMDPVIALPQIHTFLSAVPVNAPLTLFKFARDTFSRCIIEEEHDGVSNKWKDERNQLIRVLIESCILYEENLDQDTSESIPDFNWDSAKNPWFPIIA